MSCTKCEGFVKSVGYNFCSSCGDELPDKEGYQVYNFFNDTYSVLNFHGVKNLLKGGNSIYVTNSKVVLEHHLNKIGKTIK